MPDDDGYPTSDELAAIRTWPLHRPGWMDFIKGCWWAVDWGWTEDGQDTSRTYRVSTGGWSGNEEIIAAMQENELLWRALWESTRRGGHYVFRDAGQPNQVRLDSPSAAESRTEGEDHDARGRSGPPERD